MGNRILRRLAKDFQQSAQAAINEIKIPIILDDPTAAVDLHAGAPFACCAEHGGIVREEPIRNGILIKRIAGDVAEERRLKVEAVERVALKVGEVDGKRALILGEADIRLLPGGQE